MYCLERAPCAALDIAGMPDQASATEHAANGGGSDLIHSSRRMSGEAAITAFGRLLQGRPCAFDEDSLVGGEAREHHQRINQALDDLVVTRERPIRTHYQRHRLAQSRSSQGKSSGRSQFTPPEPLG